MDLGARTWLFLRELETEMKNWIAGVEMEVTELIQDAGYEVSKFVPKYFLSSSSSRFSVLKTVFLSPSLYNIVLVFLAFRVAQNIFRF